jgi:hypothetical protein
MKKAFIGLCIAAVLLVCSCATENGRNSQNGVSIEAVGGVVSGQAVGGHTGGAR